jgi:hydrogenase/urease accessory protein HupE
MAAITSIHSSGQVRRIRNDFRLVSVILRALRTLGLCEKPRSRTFDPRFTLRPGYQSSPFFTHSFLSKFVVMITKPWNLTRAVVVVLFLFFLAATARAHDPGLSAINVRLGPSEISAHLSIARSDVDNALRLHDGQENTEATAGPKPQLEAFGRAALELKIDDQPLSVRSVAMHSEDSGSVVFQIVYEYKPGVRLRVQSHILNLLARGHRQYMSIVDGRGNKLSEKVLDSTDCQLDVEVSSSPTKRDSMLLQFVALGIEHILTGYDHLVFLLGLLIAGAGFKDITRIITSFTAAHSITLALSTLDLVRISPAVVEPLIAISIVYVAVENILGHDLKWRWLLTFAFGLIHGFGFASALRDAGVGSGGSAALPLVTFNVGVELGQLFVALVALPIIWKLRRRSRFVTRLVPACSVIIGVAGMAWLVERLLAL